ncbi:MULTISPECIES: beta strand repeat-containing protein [Kordiimonas]|jgi:hypothetical protein|uniref:beta strand repeat-containing protein n=1 Tax=Kordiimonas TaxID=288021 RepID=UPI00257FE800|nr:hypothetical protein [Kordiimonas sp. UBA4487]
MLANRVRELTSTTGTGDIALDGALPGHISFSDAFGAGEGVIYVIEDGDNYEIGTGTLVDAATLARTEVAETLVDGTYVQAGATPIDLSGNVRVYCAATADFLLSPTHDADIIREVTPDAGVTADGVLLKDGGVKLTGYTRYENSLGNTVFDVGTTDNHGLLKLYDNAGTEFLRADALAQRLTIEGEALFEGAVGVGSGPAYTGLHIHQDVNAYLHLSNSSTGNAAGNGTSILVENSTTDFIINQREVGGSIRLHHTGTDVLTIGADKAVQFAGGVTVRDTQGRLVLHSTGASQSPQLIFKEDTGVERWLLQSNETNGDFELVRSGGTVVASFEDGSNAATLAGNLTVQGLTTLGSSASLAGSLAIEGAANQYLGVLQEQDINLTFGSVAGSDARIYLYGTGNGQANAGNIDIRTASNSGVVTIGGSLNALGAVSVTGTGTFTGNGAFGETVTNNPTLTIGKQATDNGGQATLGFFAKAAGAGGNGFKVSYVKNATDDELRFIDGGDKAVLTLSNVGETARFAGTVSVAASSGAYAAASQADVGTGIKIDAINSIAAEGEAYAALTWASTGSDASTGAAIAPVRMGTDSNVTGLNFYVHPTQTAADPLEIALTLNADKSATFKGNLNINGGNSVVSANYENLSIGDFTGGNNGITIQAPDTGRGGIAFSDSNTTGVASRQGRFDFDHVTDTFEWLTGDVRRMSLSGASATFTVEVHMDRRLTLHAATGNWFNISANSGAAGNFGTFKKVDGATAFAYIGGGAGAAVSAGTADDFAIRAEGSLYLASGGNTPALMLDDSQNATFFGAVTGDRYAAFLKGSATDPVFRIDSDGTGGATGFAGNSDAGSEHIMATVAGVQQLRISAGAVTFAGDVSLDGKNLKLESTSDGNNGQACFYDELGVEGGQIYAYSGELRLYASEQLSINAPTNFAGQLHQLTPDGVNAALKLEASNFTPYISMYSGGTNIQPIIRYGTGAGKTALRIQKISAGAGIDAVGTDVAVFGDDLSATFSGNVTVGAGLAAPITPGDIAIRGASSAPELTFHSGPGGALYASMKADGTTNKVTFENVMAAGTGRIEFLNDTTFAGDVIIGSDNLDLGDNSNTGSVQRFHANRTGENQNIMSLESWWDGKRVASVTGQSGTDTTGKGSGELILATAPDEATGIVTRLRIEENGRFHFHGNELTGLASLHSNVSSSNVNIAGGSTFNSGANLYLYGPDHASQASDIVFKVDATNTLLYDNSNAEWNFEGNKIVRVGPGNDVSMRIGADSTGAGVTDAVIKVGRVGVPHYLNAEEPVGVWSVVSDGTENQLRLGGATSLMNAPTEISFWTGPDATTITGSQQWKISGDGSLVSLGGTAIRRASDTGSLSFSGSTSTDVGANLVLYGASHASEAGNLYIRTDTTTLLKYDSGSNKWDFNNLALSGLGSLVKGVSAGEMVVSGGSAVTEGANIRLFGEDHATLPGNIHLRTGSTDRLVWDDAAQAWNFQSQGINSAAYVVASGNITTSGRIEADSLTFGVAPNGYYKNRFAGTLNSDGGDTVAAGLVCSIDVVGAAGDTSWLSTMVAGNGVGASITTQGNSETISTVATLYLSEPGLTVGPGDTVSNASTLYIQNAPTEGTNNYSLFVAGGTSRLDGDVHCGGVVRLLADTTANRPDATASGTGASMFDTTLGKPIWSDGSQWVDATGTAV